MENIWKKCPKTKDLILIEKQVQQFMEKHHLSGEFSVAQVEAWIFHCPARQEGHVFDPLLSRLKNCTLKDLVEFDDLFRKKLFTHVPQQVLNGLSPVRYALNLSRLQQ